MENPKEKEVIFYKIDTDRLGEYQFMEKFDFSEVNVLLFCPSSYYLSIFSYFEYSFDSFIVCAFCFERKDVIVINV